MLLRKRGIDMIMIPTLQPYGSVNIAQVKFIFIKGDRFYLIDKCGRWKITQDTYLYLEKWGIPVYERKCPTT